MAPTAGIPDRLGLSGRGLVAIGLVVASFVVSHLLMPALTPDYAVYGRYATYLLVFCVWMAWFVDWLAVRLGQDAHPSEEP